MTKEFPQGKCNFQIWNLPSGDCVYEAVQKKMDGWKPQWIESQNICAKQFGNTVNFYRSNNFSKCVIAPESNERFLLVRF